MLIVSARSDEMKAMTRMNEPIPLVFANDNKNFRFIVSFFADDLRL